jgi:hypothetical protein
MKTHKERNRLMLITLIQTKRKTLEDCAGDPWFDKDYLDIITNLNQCLNTLYLKEELSHPQKEFLNLEMGLHKTK